MDKRAAKHLDRWLRKDGLALIAGWRRWGASPREVAKKMGVTYAQLCRWADEHGDISAALEIDARAADFLVEEVVFRRAVEGDQKAAEFWLKRRASLKEDAADGGAGDGADVLRLAALIRGDRE